MKGSVQEMSIFGHDMSRKYLIICFTDSCVWLKGRGGVGHICAAGEDVLCLIISGLLSFLDFVSHILNDVCSNYIFHKVDHFCQRGGFVSKTFTFATLVE